MRWLQAALWPRARGAPPRGGSTRARRAGAVSSARTTAPKTSWAGAKLWWLGIRLSPAFVGEPERKNGLMER